MKRVLSVILSLCMLFSITAGIDFSASAADVTLAQLQQKFPSGKYWNHYVSSVSEASDRLGTNEKYANNTTSSQCYSHTDSNPNNYVGKSDCNYFDGGWQCFGFARKLGYDVFGSRVSTWSSTTSKSGVKAGDVIRYNGYDVASNSEHSVFVISVSGSTIQVGECNNGARCIISWGRSINLNIINVIERRVAPRTWNPNPTPNLSFHSYSTTNITNTSARINFKTSNPTNATITTVGARIKKNGTSTWVASIDEKTNSSYNTLSTLTTYYDISATSSEIKYKLSPGTTYVWQPYATAGGKTFYGSEQTFTTTGSSPSHTHSYSNKVTKATTSKNGQIVQTCSVCGATKTATTIYYPKTISLSATSYTYDGKVKKPTVTVKDSNGKTISSTNYTVSYASGRKNVGKYSVKITFKGNYSGTKTLYFTIKPKATTISSISAKSKGFTVKWKKQATQTTGYQIQYSTSSNFSNATTVTVSKNSTTSKTISKLKGKKKYYVRIRTYKTVSGTKYYSSWSKAKTVTTKK